MPAAMSDLTTSVRLPTLGLSLVATGACAWWLHRAHAKKGRSGGSQTALRWRQVPPAGSAQVEVKHFGETDLQAQLVVERLPPAVMQERAQAFLDLMSVRRTMRFYSSDEPPAGVIEACIETAGTSPSGAHHQPWFFVVVRSLELKTQIRALVEEEERINYERRMRKSWVDDLSSMTGDKADKRLKTADGGAPQKPYLTEAPAVIALFKQTHGFDKDGRKVDNYYVNESAGIAAGVLITALHNVGLATLTSTPMGAEVKIREILGRPDTDKLFLLLPVGYPAKDATVPYRSPLRKPVDELMKTL